ncbi:AraC family transcriptional regulator [Planotetraspora thailandica]|uniref:AraC family transcriptional regulator n=1 Tax=Planotetraspora thailandica TaxID=487172 RepID=A0A8J3V147_9ACTN|nr:AraC family transcriptional regulator [Planotetraspora thailandica]GII54761.1 AraC family transcriptional regulator [Planotetraspora thailandica]
MDAFAGLLDGPRAHHAFLIRSILEPPWSMRVQDGAPLTVVVMVRGEAWITPEHGEPARLRAGRLALLRGPEPYTVADDPATPVQTVIHPGGCATTLEGEDLCDAMSLGVRTWGNAPDGSAMMLTGTYQLRGEVGRRLLATLPPSLILRAGDGPVVSLLCEEIGKDGPGQEVLLDRLLDLLLVTALREWLSGLESAAPAWYRAHSDPVVGTALRLLHDNPAHPWTVASLAARAGVSRAALARRFTDLVGEPPMTYLTSRRLALAADLLRDPDTTVGAVARQVGYGSPFALSTAFKRVHGMSPQEHRASRN